MKSKLTKKDKTTLIISSVILIAVFICIFIYWPKTSTNDSSDFFSSESDYDIGFHDGFIETYKRLCKNKTIKFERNWENKEYQEGYMAGQLAGASKCHAEQQDNSKE